MRKRIIYILIIAAGTGLSTTTSAQNMNSPYSIYGVGDIDFRPYNRTSGMGGTGLALRSSFFLIDNNPAAIAGLTKSFFTVDGAVAGKTSKYSGDAINADNSSNKDFWIRRLAVAVKINNHWASSFGFGQFSNVNYSFNGTRNEEGSTNSYLAHYEGDGGLNEYYWTNALSIGRHFSIGLKSSIIAGGINQTEILSDQSLSTGVTTTVQDYIGHARFQGGAIYSGAISKNWNLSLGGKFAPRLDMTSQRTLTVMQDATSILDEEFVKNNRFSLPKTYAAGIALQHNKKTTYAVDYTHEDWSSLGFKQQGWQLVNSDRVSAGVEFSKQAYIQKQALERRFFQLGGFVNNSYLQVSNQQIREYGFTAGMGGVIGNGLIYTSALEVGQRGTTQQKLIRENYIQLTFTFSYRDMLLSKGRKYD